MWGGSRVETEKGAARVRLARGRFRVGQLLDQLGACINHFGSQGCTRSGSMGHRGRRGGSSHCTVHCCTCKGGRKADGLGLGSLSICYYVSSIRYGTRRMFVIRSPCGGVSPLRTLILPILLLPCFFLVGLSCVASKETLRTRAAEDVGVAVAFIGLKIDGAATAAAAWSGESGFITLAIASLVTLGTEAVPFNIFTSSSSVRRPLMSSLMHLAEVSLMFWISSTQYWTSIVTSEKQS